MIAKISGGYVVTFPDIYKVITQSDAIEKAISMVNEVSAQPPYFVQ
jgi:predicted RNase H-like HicB family nuclease